MHQDWTGFYSTASYKFPLFLFLFFFGGGSRRVKKAKIMQTFAAASDMLD